MSKESAEERQKRFERVRAKNPEIYDLAMEWWQSPSGKEMIRRSRDESARKEKESNEGYSKHS